MRFFPCAVLWASVAFFGGPPAHAQTTAQTPAAAASEPAPKRGFLWEARKGDRRIVLLGTIHVGRPEFASLSPDVTARLNEASVFAVEADASDAQRSMAALQRYALYAENEPTLDKRLDPKLRARLEALLARYGMNPASIWRMKPWFVTINLVLTEFSRAGLNPAQGTEALLFAIAARDGKRIVEIEGIDLQFKLLDGAAPSVQMAYLEQTIKSIETGAAEAEGRKIADAWGSRDFAAAEQLLSTLRAAGGIAERFVVEQLLDARHPKMLDEIERYAASGQKHVVAVGSLHYFGPNGLVAGLRNRGWSVTASQ